MVVDEKVLERREKVDIAFSVDRRRVKSGMMELGLEHCNDPRTDW